jgi:hypothetical protein
MPSTSKKKQQLHIGTYHHHDDPQLMIDQGIRLADEAFSCLRAGFYIAK